ncbi:unnamed protein product [Didymodactylos carnosus]|uniref:Uncharacterized protein n=1 Tax=Didymodactylos carnosus TaxID=1234261 RepID=A0A815V6G0_9BILA|nr:unnamed protein product [Didymodactylos carnosus]CAF4384214.1 unnamed protein product [Didymodactylos carnosus]
MTDDIDIDYYLTYPQNVGHYAGSYVLDIAECSDHLTVWLDRYIGVPNDNQLLKTKFQRNIQPLNTLTAEEAEVDEGPLTLVDEKTLEKLKYDVYCLKPYSDISECLKFIKSQDNKKIFFISSGTIGKESVPQIAELPQIHRIYIFCANIAFHAEWAMEHVDRISAMLEHHDDLLQRLTEDIADYLEEKGDDHLAHKDNNIARHCYAWATKLTFRTRDLVNTYVGGDANIGKTLARLKEKFDEAEKASQPTD